LEASSPDTSPLASTTVIMLTARDPRKRKTPQLKGLRRGILIWLAQTSEAGKGPRFQF
jgi:hypothetical protein